MGIITRCWSYLIQIHLVVTLAGNILWEATTTISIEYPANSNWKVKCQSVGACYCFLIRLRISSISCAISRFQPPRGCKLAGEKVWKGTAVFAIIPARWIRKYSGYTLIFYETRLLVYYNRKCQTYFIDGLSQGCFIFCSCSVHGLSSWPHAYTNKNWHDMIGHE